MRGAQGDGAFELAFATGLEVLLGHRIELLQRRLHAFEQRQAGIGGHQRADLSELLGHAGAGGLEVLAGLIGGVLLLHAEGDVGAAHAGDQFPGAGAHGLHEVEFGGREADGLVEFHAEALLEVVADAGYQDAEQHQAAEGRVDLLLKCHLRGPAGASGSVPKR